MSEKIPNKCNNTVSYLRDLKNATVLMAMFAMCVTLVCWFARHETWFLMLFKKLSNCLNATILKSFRIFVVFWTVEPIIGDVMNSVTDIHVTILAKYKNKMQQCKTEKRWKLVNGWYQRYLCTFWVCTTFLNYCTAFSFV